MATYIKALLLIVLLFVAITFGTQNSEPVMLRYYSGLTSTPLPLYLVIYAAIILGVIVGMAIGVYSRVNLKRAIKRLERENASLREETEKSKVETGEGVQEKEEIGLTEPQSVAKQLSNSSIGDG